METKDTQNEIIDLGGKDFFAQIPNLLDDMDISKEAYRLYCHFKRACGANDEGRSTATTEYLAIICDMSVKTVTKVKRELASYKIPLITINIIKRANGDKGVRHSIEINNIWEINSKHYRALKIENINKKNGTNLPYNKSDIIRFKKAKALQELNDKKSSNGKNDHPIRVQAMVKTTIKEEPVLRTSNTRIFEKPSKITSTSTFSKFKPNQQALLRFFMELYHLEDKDLPTKDYIHKWKSTINKMLSSCDNDEKLAKTIMQRVFNGGTIVSALPIIKDYFDIELTKYKIELDENKKIAKENAEQRKREKEYVPAEDGVKLLNELTKSMKRNNA
jgi:hypothetical protein